LKDLLYAIDLKLMKVKRLAYDIWFQMFAWFIICIVERGKIVDGQQGFTIFAILFEVTSAYGTVGLSTGVPYDSYSLSGAFQSLSKVIMLAVMLRGRHRGLPLAIDRSILLPGEDLMHQMDRDYNELGFESMESEKEVRREENDGKAPESRTKTDEDVEGHKETQIPRD
jgi:hypothetical protein